MLQYRARMGSLLLEMKSSQQQEHYCSIVGILINGNSNSDKTKFGNLAGTLKQGELGAHTEQVHKQITVIDYSSVQVR